MHYRELQGGFKIKKTLSLNFEQMKIISDKNKMNILNAFELEKSLTVTEISNKLEMPYSRVNYHVKLLENAGLLEVVDTKIKSGIVEKYYLPTAEEFKIDKSISIFEDTEEKNEYEKGVKKFYNAILKGLLEDYKAIMESGSVTNELNMLNSVIFLNEDDVEEVNLNFKNFLNYIVNKYGDIQEGTKAYSIFNFVLPKKNQGQYFQEMPVGKMK